MELEEIDVGKSSEESRCLSRSSRGALRLGAFLGVVVAILGSQRAYAATGELSTDQKAWCFEHPEEVGPVAQSLGIVFGSFDGDVEPAQGADPIPVRTWAELDPAHFVQA